MALIPKTIGIVDPDEKKQKLMVAGSLRAERERRTHGQIVVEKLLVLRSSLTSFSTPRSKIGLLKVVIPSAAYQQDSTAVPPNPCVSPPHNLENKTVQPDCDQKKNTGMTRERERERAL